ncbi:MAG TPA: cation:proton antiporter [Vicinamibacterales bacterium]
MSSRALVPWLLAAVALGLLIGGLVIMREGSAQTDALGRLALALTVILIAALVGGHLVARVGQPPVLGELVVGAVLGNMPGLGALHFVGTDPYVDILARVGMLLLLFEVGLELSVGDLFLVGSSALGVAMVGTAASLVLGTLAAVSRSPGAPFAANVFLGAAITATSVGITARVLRDIQASRSAEARVILGAAVIDDVLALVVLGAVSVWATTAPGSASQAGTIAALAMKTVGFLVLAVVLGARWTPAWFRGATRLRGSGALLAIGLALCFFLSWAASAIGLASLVGAFAAGLVLEDSHSELFVRRGERPLGELLQPLTSFLVPLFFVLVGFRMNVGVLLRPEMLALSAVLLLAAIGGKLACAGGVLSRGVARLPVAIGMMPRGEVTLVFAALGGTLQVGGRPLLDERGYAALVAVVIGTTLLTPPLLKWSLTRTPRTRLTQPAA